MRLAYLMQLCKTAQWKFQVLWGTLCLLLMILRGQNFNWKLILELTSWSYDLTLSFMWNYVDVPWRLWKHPDREPLVLSLSFLWSQMTYLVRAKHDRKACGHVWVKRLQRVYTTIKLVGNKQHFCFNCWLAFLSHHIRRLGVSRLSTWPSSSWKSGMDTSIPLHLQVLP